MGAVDQCCHACEHTEITPTSNTHCEATAE